MYITECIVLCKRYGQILFYIINTRTVQDKIINTFILVQLTQLQPCGTKGMQCSHHEIKRSRYIRSQSLRKQDYQARKPLQRKPAHHSISSASPRNSS